MSYTKYKNNNTDKKDKNKIENKYRTIKFEIQQITKVFPDTHQEDFFILSNGNKCIRNKWYKL